MLIAPSFLSFLAPQVLLSGRTRSLLKAEQLHGHCFREELLTQQRNSLFYLQEIHSESRGRDRRNPREKIVSFSSELLSPELGSAASPAFS